MIGRKVLQVRSEPIGALESRIKLILMNLGVVGGTNLTRFGFEPLVIK